MLHSTGANNPWLRRYAPDDGLWGKRYNTTEQDMPDLVFALMQSVNAEAPLPPIKLTLEPSWKACRGRCNNTQYSFERCDLSGLSYFAIYKEAIEFCIISNFINEKILSPQRGISWYTAKLLVMQNWFPNKKSCLLHKDIDNSDALNNTKFIAIYAARR